ncbi:isopenicillin N synthase family oxygenase [Lampropedia puyangensis]|uniref:Isopenicillin N synthase family oxygenase n=1 Tax=Lampropedia puyangensis TaxID=1330072 RepID=A0A4S8EUX0_9BURK|nr:2-oxoglutarate and iron-dependent oxygenase domain-containing protein [Lampropedia puyangensis]THT98248.1 isopenicillin N synthase family oxygenase [Lampropedia puyangensis]
MSAALPIIDIGPLRTGDVAAQRGVAQQLGQACQERGFFYVVNHGVDSALIESVFACSRAFFSQEDAAKNALDKRHSMCNRGYEPLRAQTLEAGAAPDLKESFYIGAEVPADDPRVLAKRFNTGPNQWPEQPTQFRTVMQAYYTQAYALGARLIRAFGLSLGVEDDYFDAYLHEAAATLRLLHYPPQPVQPAEREQGCGAHTDFGGLTLLLQDQAGGLQVWDTLHNNWMDAPPVDGAYVVNIGDLMARWTNDHYVSTLHRVINRSGGQRYSVPFFFTGNPLHEIRCIPSCLTKGQQPKYPTVTVEQHQIACYQRTYG